MSILAQDDYIFYFNTDHCSIFFENKIVVHAFMIDSLYHLHVNACVNVNEQVVNAIGSKRPRDRLNRRYLWCLRLEPVGEDRINKLEKDSILGPLTSKSYPVCESCLQEKIAKLPLVRHGERTTEILALVHTDV